MADFNSSLPVRTESPGDVEIKVVDGVVTANKLKVESDGSINVNTNIDETVTVEATDLDIRDLEFATDKVDVSGSEVSLDTATINTLKQVTVINAGAGDAVNIQDGGNSITVDAINLDIRDLTFATDKVDVSGSTIDIQAIDKIGIVNFNSAESLALNASSTHTYTATGDFRLKRIEATGSGKIKVEVKVNSVTKFVAFNSTANPNISIDLGDTPDAIASTETIEVIRTNRDSNSQDIYSTIIGYNE